MAPSNRYTRLAPVNWTKDINCLYCLAVRHRTTLSFYRLAVLVLSLYDIRNKHVQYLLTINENETKIRLI